MKGIKILVNKKCWVKKIKNQKKKLKKFNISSTNH